MQGQKKDLDSYPNAVDYDQGTSSDNTDINQSASRRNVLNWQASPHPNLMSYAGANQDARMLRGRGSNEPSSSSKSKTIANDDGLKMEQGWPYSFRAGPGSSSRSEDVEFESRMSFPTISTVGHNVCSNSSHCSFAPHARSNSTTQCTDQNPGCMGGNHKHLQALSNDVFSNFLDNYNSTKPDPISPAYYNHFGSSSGSSSYSLEEMDGSGSSVGCWGQSSKRKLHEGASSQSYPSGTSGSFTHNQNSNVGHCNNAFDGINFPLNPRIRTDGSAAQLNHGNSAQPDTCPPLHTDEDTTERSLRNFYSVRNLRQPQDMASFDSSLDENGRQSNVQMFEPSSQAGSYSGSLRMRSAAVVRPNSRSRHIESEDMYISPPSSGLHAPRQSGSSFSRPDHSLPLLNFGLNLDVASQDEYNAFISATELRNLGQDPPNWSLATGPDNPAMFPSSSRTRTSISSPLSPPPWFRHQNPPSQIQERIPGFAPWTLFPSFDDEVRNQSSHSPPLPSLSSGSPSEVISSRPSSHNVQQAHRRLGFMSQRVDDAVVRLPHPFREMAADMEGRRLLFSEIRQVLGGVRRGDNIRIEDYIMFDPFIYQGLTEVHDRHRDMRLDVDNMSYEELLALEEHIGDVNTGLSEKSIRKNMKQHKYVCVATPNSTDVEPCCVCQEDFFPDDDLGKLDCGHDFHVQCIKQWLLLKNLCPICKTTGLAT
ncbi:unnamed protein product [Rhodiola kirilowii]